MGHEGNWTATGIDGTQRASHGLRRLTSRMAAAAVLAGTALLLGACQPTTSQAAADLALAAAPVSSIRSSPDAGPGGAPVSVARARAVFAALCVSTGGERRRTEQAAAADGFVLNTTYGTYYHPRDNLSVKLTGGDCSMVFVSRAAEAELRTALTSLNAGRPPIRWQGALRVAGDPYYNVRIAAQ